MSDINKAICNLDCRLKELESKDLTTVLLGTCGVLITAGSAPGTYNVSGNVTSIDSINNTSNPPQNIDEVILSNTTTNCGSSVLLGARSYLGGKGVRVSLPVSYLNKKIDINLSTSADGTNNSGLKIVPTTGDPTTDGALMVDPSNFSSVSNYTIDGSGNYVRDPSAITDPTNPMYVGLNRIPLFIAGGPLDIETLQGFKSYSGISFTNTSPDNLVKEGIYGIKMNDPITNQSTTGFLIVKYTIASTTVSLMYIDSATGNLYSRQQSFTGGVTGAITSQWVSANSKLNIVKVPRALPILSIGSSIQFLVSEITLLSGTTGALPFLAVDTNGAILLVTTSPSGGSYTATVLSIDTSTKVVLSSSELAVTIGGTVTQTNQLNVGDLMYDTNGAVGVITVINSDNSRVVKTICISVDPGGNAIDTTLFIPKSDFNSSTNSTKTIVTNLENIVTTQGNSGLLLSLNADLAYYDGNNNKLTLVRQSTGNIPTASSSILGVTLPYLILNKEVLYEVSGSNVSNNFYPQSVINGNIVLDLRYIKNIFRRFKYNPGNNVPVYDLNMIQYAGVVTVLVGSNTLNLPDLFSNLFPNLSNNPYGTYITLYTDSASTIVSSNVLIPEDPLFDPNNTQTLLALVTYSNRAFLRSKAPATTSSTTWSAWRELGGSSTAAGVTSVTSTNSILGVTGTGLTSAGKATGDITLSLNLNPGSTEEQAPGTSGYETIPFTLSSMVNYWWVWPTSAPTNRLYAIKFTPMFSFSCSTVSIRISQAIGSLNITLFIGKRALGSQALITVLARTADTNLGNATAGIVNIPLLTAILLNPSETYYIGYQCNGASNSQPSICGYLYIAGAGNMDDFNYSPPLCYGNGTTGTSGVGSYNPTATTFMTNAVSNSGNAFTVFVPWIRLGVGS